MWSLPARSAVRRSSRRLTVLGLGGALGLSVLTACGGDAEPAGGESRASQLASTDPSPSSTPRRTRSAAPEATATPTPTPPAEPTSTTAVGVYYVADAPQGQRLFREFRSVDADDPLVGAAALLTGGSTLDPDYASLLPRGSFDDVRRGDDGALEVVLPDDSWTTRPPGLTRRQATLAVQQVVYTLQGVEQERVPLRAYVAGDDAAVDLLGVPTAEGVTQRRPLRVLGLVNVTTPEEATTVSGRFTASGVASSFEGTVPWEVRDGDRVLLDGIATADGYLGRLYPWSTTVRVGGLPAGTYTFAASTSDPSGGEGTGPTEDTKTIIVE